MSLKNQNPTQTTAWNKLKNSFSEIKNLEMRSLFQNDTNRKEKYTLICQ